MLKTKSYKHQAVSGFTLVELLVAVGIIGVLASVSVVSVNSVRAKGRDAKRVSEVKQMQTALEAYFSNSASASYPVLGTDAAPATLGTGNQIKLCNTALGFDTAANCDNAANAPVFMARAPRDPSNGAQIGGASYEYTYKSRTAANADCAAAPCPSYEIGFRLEGGTGGLAGGARTATPNGLQ